MAILRFLVRTQLAVATALAVTTLVSPRAHAGRLEVERPFPLVLLLDEEGNKAPAVPSEAPLVLVQVWATWCAPCHEALPRLLQAVQAEGGGEVSVVLWNIDSEIARAKRFLQTRGLLKRPVVYRFDPGGREFGSLGAPGMPTTVLVSFGKIVALFGGYSPDTERGILAALREAHSKHRRGL